jgi:hypothetical protein
VTPPDIIHSLLLFIKENQNPLLIADRLSWFISDSLRVNRCSLYESYLLNDYVLHLKREGYTKPAWMSKVHISTCLSLLNQLLLCHFFQDKDLIQRYRNWCNEAGKLNQEKRPHYIMDRFADFLDAPARPELLRELAAVRHHYATMSYDNGPFHVESFPYHFYSPEELLSNPENDVRHATNVSPSICELIVTLSIRFEQ